MGRHVPVCWSLTNKGRKFIWVVVAVLLAWPGEASVKRWPDYDEPYGFPVVAIPKGRGIGHFFGTWESLNRTTLGITGAMIIGPSPIKYSNTYDKFYRVVRVTNEYAILVVRQKNPYRVGVLTQFELLTLRRDPKDGETLLFRGVRSDFRMIDEPLNRPLDFYRQLLDNPDDRVLPPGSGPWGQWGFSAFEPYKN